MTQTSSNTLNQGQEEAARSVFQFLFSDDKEFSISGPAGTGKTHLMKHILNETLKEYEDASHLMGKKPVDYEVFLCATTNKAAEVLASSTGFPAVTIHSHMNLKVQDDYKTGVSKITRGSNWKVHSKQLIFIDEASMIDSALYRHIIEGTDKTCKIVYLGDHCQMAPVFEEISPVYRRPKHSALLTQPMRNAGQPALINLCNQLRHTVETLQFQPILPVPGVIDYVDPLQAQAFIDQTFISEEPGCRVLAYSNNRVKDYLDYIRNLRGYPDLFIKGERLINNTGIQIGSRMLRVEEEFIVHKVVKQPYEEVVDQRDPNAILDVYQIELLSPLGGSPISVRVPVYPDHHKALMKYFAKNKNWERYYWLKNTFPDLRQRDAATVYKAQGSTYDTVLLDLDNIGKCTQKDQLARMLYVGASRAQNRLLLFGDLPARLFNQAA